MASDTYKEINVPAYHEMLWPTLQALKQMGGSGTIQEIMDSVIEREGYTEAQQRVIHGKGPGTEISYRLPWARTYLKIVGAVENSSRGVWTITDLGRGLSKADMEAIPTTVRKMSRKKSVPPGKSAEEVADETDLLTEVPIENEAGTFSSTVFEKWRDVLLNELLAIPPSGFERLCQRLLRESGFTKVEVTGRSGDGGIDGIGVLRISLLSFQVFFQCKRYKGSVGAEEVRSFRGAMVGRTDKGLLITTGTYTSGAKKEATRDGAPVIDLIDGDQLCILLKDLKLGVSTQQVEEVSIDPHWFSEI
ncbi:MAG: restriction endonuclease [Chloroflexota bacterium]|nr:restriction endonuclease [Chloroflexota bacterium]